MLQIAFGYVTKTNQINAFGWPVNSDLLQQGPVISFVQGAFLRPF